MPGIAIIHLYYTIWFTEPPGQPMELSVTRITQNSIGIQWGAPSFVGRPDIYYTIEYSDPNNVGQYILASTGHCWISLRYVITGLTPATGYHIRVLAHNGVSDQDLGGIFSRMAEITATTSNARKSCHLTNYTYKTESPFITIKLQVTHI